MKKKLMTVLALVLVIAMSVAGTYAYLTSTDSVKNTFTVGNVAITMDEAKVDAYGNVLNGEDAGRDVKNTYKLIPGHEYTKDPTIHVTQGSEPCYVFAKIENGLAGVSTIDIDTTKWEALGNGVYAYKTTVDAREAAQNVVVFEHFTFTGSDPTNYETTNANDVNITVTGYAVQAEGFDNAQAAWNATFGK